MARRRSNKKSTTAGLGEARFLVVMILLGAAPYFLKDYSGANLRLVGSYIWISAFVITFVIRLFYLAQFILPLRWYESWYEGLRLTIGYNFPTFSSMLGARSYSPNRRVKAAGLTPGLTPGLMNHRSGMVGSQYALALTRGPTFTRATGPGYVTLNSGEQVAQVIDLRRHMRQKVVEAVTRDGIPLETSVSVVFQVARDEAPADLDLPYPYDPAAIFHLNYLENFNTDEGVLPWSEHPARQAAGALVAELSRYTLDELFQAEPTGTPALEEVSAEITRQMERSFGQQGIEILSVSVGRILLPEPVTQQRINYWQSKWRSRIRDTEAAGDAAAIRAIRLARARAQVEIIENITASIEAARKSGEADITEIVALRMIEAMKEAAADQEVQALVPQYVTSALGQIQEWVRQWEEQP